MIHTTYHLELPGSQPYARLVTYIQEYSGEMAIRKRPLVIMCPGGGYEYTSDREAEPIVNQLLAMGYHAAILYYSVKPAVFPTALTELAASVLLVRENAEAWHVDEDAVLVMGGSAGGHLAASYACFWNEDWVADAIGYEGDDHEILRPNGQILMYPVITSGEYAHRGSFDALLGPDKDDPDMLKKMSLEYRVNADTPPAFIWHTYEDGSVPVENSLFYITALRKAGINAELHIFPKGGHGLALADETTLSWWSGSEICEAPAAWVGLLKTWLRSNYSFTFEFNPEREN